MFKMASHTTFISIISIMNRTKSTAELDRPEVNGTANHMEKIHFAVPSFPLRPQLGDLTGKNWTYLTNEVTDFVHWLVENWHFSYHFF